MSQGLSAEHRAFRDEVRAFVQANLPEDIKARARQGFHSTKEDMRRWTEILHQRGWSCANWPKEYGGPGWTPVQRMIFDMVRREGYRVVNCDITVIAEAPKLSPFRDQIRSRICKILEIPVSDVSLKATTHEGLGTLGRGEGIAALAIALLQSA